MRLLHFLILGLVIFTQPRAWGQFELINKDLPAQLIKNFEEMAAEPDSDSFLENLAFGYPEARFMVLDLPIAVESLQGDEILWRPENVRVTDETPYLEYMKGRIDSIGFHIAAGEVMDSIPGRPLFEHPLVVVKKLCPFHGVLHEALHLMINAAPDRGQVEFPDSEKASEILKGIYEYTGEEVLVDTIILERRESLKLNEQAACQRMDYLNQNLQLLESRLDELNRFRENSPLVNDHIRRVYNGARKARVLRTQLHTLCFLKKYRTQ